MRANLKNSGVATGLEKVSFHSNPKERQCQRVLKLPHSCTYLTCQQSNAQNSPSQASTVHEQRTSRCSSWIQEEKKKKNRETRDQIPNICWKIKKKKKERVPEKHLLLLLSRFSRVRLCATPQTKAHQAPPSLGFSRQEHWSGLPFPSPMHKSEK